MCDTKEVGVIITLTYPENEHKECGFSVPMTRGQLPSRFWHETDDHFSAVYTRVGNSLIYKYQETMPRRTAMENGVAVL
jgi:hypothetical protein